MGMREFCHQKTESWKPWSRGMNDTGEVAAVGHWRPGLPRSVHQRPGWCLALGSPAPHPTPPGRAQQGPKATFPRQSRWSRARPQSAPLTAVPAQSPEHLRVWSEGNQSVSITCQEGSSINASLFPKKLYSPSNNLRQTCSLFSLRQLPVGS